MKRYLIVTGMMLAVGAQAQLQRNYSIPVTQDGVELHNAWAGGINSAQLSTIDVNMDGLEDIFLFDRVGSRVDIFINMDGTPGAMNYKYTLEYNHIFPDNLRNWTFLRDMNCDGKKDICTNSGSSFKIYYNTSSETTLSFTATPTNAIRSAYDFAGGTSPDYYAGIYSIAPDLPAIADYDGDGDMDMWTWGDTGNIIFFYKNMQAENEYCDTTSFELRNRCYGEFVEAIEGFTLYLDTVCTFNTAEPRAAEPGPLRHTGGTILTLDLDDNGLQDLVISDVTESNDAALLITDASDMVDSAFVAHLDFPVTFTSDGSQAVMLDKFPGNFYEDVNNDGVRDLIVSPNAYSDAEDRNGMWLYLNEGTNSLPDFHFHTKSFLHDEMIDIGTSCFPIAFDVDNDGLHDLLVSNRLFYDTSDVHTSRIWYYHNVGDDDEPAFALADTNWMNMEQYGFETVYFTFGDLDDDGDDDMVLGEQDGYLHYFANTAGADLPCVFALTTSPMLDATNQDLDVGQLSSPQLVDLNEDGLLDLVTGELNGCVSYFQNIGTEAVYNFQLIEDSIGNVAATSALGIQGKSIPFLFKNELNLWQLLIATETGQINHYNNIEGNILGYFDLVTEDYMEIDEGERSSVFMQDLNNDDVADLLIGNIAGGLGIYMSTGIGVFETVLETEIVVYPNPAIHQFSIASLSYPIEEVAVFDGCGRLLLQSEVHSQRTNVDVSQLANGVYHLSVHAGNSLVSKRIVVFR
ncbi:MAG: T9SS type A sorting domain-containing protein [Flavobacteriales bacterium]